MKYLLVVAAAMVLAACGSAPKNEVATANPTANADPAADKTSTTVAPGRVSAKRVAAKPSAKTSAVCDGKKIQLVDGASYVGQYYSLVHYNDVTVRLLAGFAPSKLILNMRPDRIGDSKAPVYPVVKVALSRKGVEGVTDLGTFVLSKEEAKTFDLKGLEAGEYYVRLNYGATEPQGTARPTMEIRSVELRK